MVERSSRYRRLGGADRRMIAAGLADGASLAELGRRLGRPTSTISREISRNGGNRGYRAEWADATARRRGRNRLPGTPTPVPSTPSAAAVDELAEELTTLLIETGLSALNARLLACLYLAENDGLSTTQLTARLAVSPASVSRSVRYLEGLQLISRSRIGRKDWYRVDADAWQRAWAETLRLGRRFSALLTAGAEVVGPDTDAGRRLTDSGSVLRLIVDDVTRSANRWNGSR